MRCVSQDSEENRGWERCVAFSTLLSLRVKFRDITLDGGEEGDGDDGDGSGQDGPGNGAAPHHLVHLRRQELWQLDVSFQRGDDDYGAGELLRRIEQNTTCTMYITTENSAQ